MVNEQKRDNDFWHHLEYHNDINDFCQILTALCVVLCFFYIQSHIYIHTHIDIDIYIYTRKQI